MRALAVLVRRPLADVVRTLSYASLDEFLRCNAARAVAEQQEEAPTSEDSRPSEPHRAQGHDVAVHEGLTRGSPQKRKRFWWWWNGTLHICRENRNRQHDEFSIAELERILEDLEGQFRSGWFPLANNVAKMPNGTEKPGLGMTIFRIRPEDTMHAQASSYLGVVFEQIGLATWNRKSWGIEWRLNGKVPTGDELAGLLARGRVS